MIPILVILVLSAIIIGLLTGIIALVRVGKLSADLNRLSGEVNDLEKRAVQLQSDLRALQTAQVHGDKAPEPAPVREAATPTPQPQSQRADRSPSVGFPDSSKVPPLQKIPAFQRTAAKSTARWESFEEVVGKQWMTWAGAVVLFLSAAFFVKYAFDNSWLGPTGRVALGIVFGLSLAVLGDHFVGRGMKLLGQGMIGGALAVLYLSVFAAFSYYALIGQVPAFGFMVGITAFGMILAVLHDAMPLGFIAVLGGFAVPLLVSTGQDSRDILFGYLLVLDLGVFGAAFFRKWRQLDVLAMVGTWIMFAGWFFKFYREAALVPAMIWIAIFFVIFLILPFVYFLRRAVEAGIDQFLMSMTNAVVTFYFSYEILKRDHTFVLGFAALAIAASYLTLAVFTRRRVPSDGRSLFGFVGLAVVFLTMAVPLHLKLHGVTLAWAVEGPVLLFLGFKFDYFPARAAGFIVVCLAAARLFVLGLPYPAESAMPFLNARFLSAMFVPSAFGAYALVQHFYRMSGHDWDRILKTAAATASVFIAAITIHLELRHWLFGIARDYEINAHYLSRGIPAVVWAMAAGAYLAGAVRFDSRVSWIAGVGSLLIGTIIVLDSYSFSVGSAYMLFLNLRFAAALVFSGTVAIYFFVTREYISLPAASWNRAVLIAAGLFPLIFLSLETYFYCLSNIKPFSRASWMSQMSLSIVWGLYAAVGLCVGFLKRVKEIRLAALGLLALTVGKLLLVDTAHVQQIYRIISFVVIGVIMMSASYLYHRMEKRIGSKPEG